ncbi:MAG TPA: glycosyltransferase, partial [Thermoplasmata archaeon]|nr:glycosyltransferase [Thermoplasmata archaeon]
MRILYLGDGTSVHLRRWVAWFAARGHDVHLITKACEPIPAVGITVAPLHEGAYRPRRHLRRAVADTVRSVRPDIVHAHYVQAWGHYAALAKVHPLVVSAWGSDIAKDPDEHWYARAAARRVV